MQFLDPKVDTAFKKLFGSEDHKRVTIAFLNAILEYKGDKRIASITFMNNEQLPIAMEKKENILDIFCTDEGGRQYIIEMQNAWEKGFAKRILWYATKAYANQLNAARPYHELNPVVIVAITKSFNVFPNKLAYKSIHEMRDRVTNEHDLPDLTLAFVELPKFKKTEQELVTDEDKWLFLLKEIYNYDHIPQPLEHAELGEACRALNRMSWTENAFTLYEKTMIKAQSAEASEKRSEEAERNLQIALQGLKQAQKDAEQGKKDAEKQLAKAKKDAEKSKEEERYTIAKQLLDDGMPIAKVAKITGLSVDELKKLN